MRDLAVLFIHLITTVARLAAPGVFRCRWIRSGQAATADPESSPGTFTNLRVSDRIVAGLCAVLMRHGRLIRSTIVLKPSTVLSLHQALKDRKYRLLFSPKARKKPDPKRPSQEVIAAVVQMKQRNQNTGPTTFSRCLSWTTAGMSWGLWNSSIENNRLPKRTRSSFKTLLCLSVSHSRTRAFSGTTGLSSACAAMLTFLRFPNHQFASAIGLHNFAIIHKHVSGMLCPLTRSLRPILCCRIGPTDGCDSSLTWRLWKLLRSRQWVTSHLDREAHSSAAATVMRPSFACVISLCSSCWTSTLCATGRSLKAGLVCRSPPPNPRELRWTAFAHRRNWPPRRPRRAVDSQPRRFLRVRRASARPYQGAGHNKTRMVRKLRWPFYLAYHNVRKVLTKRAVALER